PRSWRSRPTPSTRRPGRPASPVSSGTGGSWGLQSIGPTSPARQPFDTPDPIRQNDSGFMEQTLLLNATYEPLKVVHWQKAITLWCQGKVEVISTYEREVRSPSFSFKLPSVIRLLRFIRIKRRIDYVPFSRANIYARDENTCQYCAERLLSSELTFDHVVPV